MKTGVSKERRGKQCLVSNREEARVAVEVEVEVEKKGGGKASPPTSSVVAASPKQLFPPLTYPRGLPEEPPEPEIARFE